MSDFKFLPAEKYDGAVECKRNKLEQKKYDCYLSTCNAINSYIQQGEDGVQIPSFIREYMPKIVEDLRMAGYWVCVTYNTDYDKDTVEIRHKKPNILSQLLFRWKGPKNEKSLDLCRDTEITRIERVGEIRTGNRKGIE